MEGGKFRVKDDRSFDTFRIRLRSLLDSRGYTMKDLGMKVDMNATSISRYFIDRNPDTIALWRIADHFNVSIDWLLGRSANRFDLPDDVQRLITLYQAATSSDKSVIDMLLSKYDV